MFLNQHRSCPQMDESIICLVFNIMELQKSKNINSLFTRSKQKWHYSSQLELLNSFLIILIGWLKAGPSNKPLLL